jgi:LmbE family N-acetylglucosaminyl deacetylase
VRLQDWLRRRRTARQMRLLASWWNLYSARFSYPRLIELPAGQRILTLSPHPDDDVIGVGGTLLKHHEAGCILTTVVLTDGGAGNPEWKRSDLVRTRRNEQRTAAALVGIDSVVFWDEPDGGLAADDQNATQLRAALQDVQPELVYLPPFFDSHPDHQVVTSLLHRALQGTGLSFDCAVYEAGTPLVPNVLVDISAQMEAKLRAVGEHRSQLEHVDYLDLVRALGRWRSGAFSRTAEYAEAFYLDNVYSYLALWQQAVRG